MKIFNYLALTLTLSLSLSLIAALPAQARNKKKKVVYKKYTQLDFSGESIQGKVRAPEVFYIFQRRQSGGQRVTSAPLHLNHHQDWTTTQLKRALPK